MVSPKIVESIFLKSKIILFLIIFFTAFNLKAQQIEFIDEYSPKKIKYHFLI